ncbi:hypothetical protein F5880DRAFT_1592845, partial [Lentinula raphanica]
GILSCSLTLTSTSAIASSLVAHLIVHHLHLVACHPVLRHSLALPTVQLVTHRYHSIPHRTRPHQAEICAAHCTPATRAAIPLRLQAWPLPNKTSGKSQFEPGETKV